MLHGTSQNLLSGLAIAVCGITLCAVACVPSYEVLVEPVLPSDDPNLLSGIDFFRAQATPVGQQAESVTQTANQGEPLGFNNLAHGLWLVKLQGFSCKDPKDRKTCQPIVSGQTQPFRVAKGENAVARLHLGRLGAFNLFDVHGPDDATVSSLSGLVNHTATALTDAAGRTQILVAGGNLSRGAQTTSEALLIDLDTLTLKRLPSGLLFPRASHTAVAVQGPDDVTRIALAGGCTGRSHKICDRIIEVFDPQAQRFETIEVPCAEGPIRGLAAEVERRPDDSFATTGRLIVLGDESCIVDLYEPHRFESANIDPPALGHGVSYAVSPSGRIATLDESGALTLGLARAPKAGNQNNEANPHVTAELSLRSAATLFPLDGDRFLAIGLGQRPGQHRPLGDGALIQVTDDGVFEIVEGPFSFESARESFASFALQDNDASHPRGPTTRLMLTGGTRANESEPTRSVSFFITDAQPRASVWFDLSDTSLELRQARAGHAAVHVPDGAVWLIGGDDAGTVEMYLPRTEPAVDHRWEFQGRRPNITSIVVLDSKPENKFFSSLFIDNYIAYLDDLFNTSKQARSIVNAFASADRGVGDEILTTHLKNPERLGSEYWRGCASVAVSTSSPVEGVLAYGDVDDELRQKLVGSDDPESKWRDVQSESEAQHVGADVLGNIYSPAPVNLTDSAMPAGFGQGRPWPSMALDPRFPSTQEEATCPWQQFLRVGFDNLPGPGFPSAFGGVNVLTFIGSNDDCSEGFYSPSLADLSEEEADKLSEAIVTEQSCGARAADDYLGFDDDLVNDAVFQAALDNRTNDKQDFILAFVHIQHGDEQKGSPRRLEAANHAALMRGLKTHWIEVKLPRNATPESIVEQMALPGGFSSVAQSIEARNRLQVCLPLRVSKEADSAPPTKTTNDLFQHEGGGPSEKTVAKHCHVMVATRPAAKTHSGAAAYSAAARYPQKFWHLGTDTDRLAGCDPGWTVELDADILMSEVGFGGQEIASSTLRDAYLKEKLDIWLACDPEVQYLR